MPQSITIPASIDDAVDQLTGIGELITARKWERAAIVAAFVRLDLGHGGRETVSSDRFESARQFAERGIVGLSSHVSVTKYVQAWLDENNDRYPRPGSTRRLPTGPFPPMRTGTDGYASPSGVEATVGRLLGRHEPEAIIDALTDEQVEEVVAAATERRPEAAQRGRTRPIRERAERSGARPPGGGSGIVDFGPDATWMDVDREIGRLHSAIVLLAGWNTSHPAVMQERVDRLKNEHELLGMVVDGARGLTTDDLAQMLEES